MAFWHGEDLERQQLTSAEIQAIGDQAAGGPGFQLLAWCGVPQIFEVAANQQAGEEAWLNLFAQTS